MKYSNMANKLYMANETEIYELTGCLSNCDKYQYEVEPMTDIITLVDEVKTRYANTMELKFVFTDGRHELKEQVKYQITKLYQFGIYVMKLFARLST